MDVTLIIFLALLVLLFVTVFNKKQEKYYLRDIPFGLGFGGYPPGLYSRGINVGGYRAVPLGMYGAPLRDGELGYDPGAGLVW